MQFLRLFLQEEFPVPEQFFERPGGHHIDWIHSGQYLDWITRVRILVCSRMWTIQEQISFNHSKEKLIYNNISGCQPPATKSLTLQTFYKNTLAIMELYKRLKLRKAVFEMPQLLYKLDMCKYPRCFAVYFEISTSICCMKCKYWRDLGFLDIRNFSSLYYELRCHLRYFHNKII